MKTHKLIGIAFAAMTAFTLASQANAGAIIAAADSNIGGNNTFFTNVFSGQDVFARNGGSKPWSVTNWSGSVGAVASSISIGSTLTAASIVGAEWVIAGGNAAWTAPELAVLSTFASNGGNVWVVGEYGSGHNDISTAGNAALAALGSAMTFGLNIDTSAFATNIAVHPYTAGVASWTGGSSGEVFGGIALATNADGRVLVATEVIVPVAIPEPGTLALLGLGLVGIAYARRRKAA